MPARLTLPFPMWMNIEGHLVIWQRDGIGAPLVEGRLVGASFWRLLSATASEGRRAKAEENKAAAMGRIVDRPQVTSGFLRQNGGRGLCAPGTCSSHLCLSATGLPL